jgi:hypothetical protein
MEQLLMRAREVVRLFERLAWRYRTNVYRRDPGEAGLWDGRLLTIAGRCRACPFLPSDKATSCGTVSCSSGIAG